jgi:hypothetical protein
MVITPPVSRFHHGIPPQLCRDSKLVAKISHIDLPLLIAAVALATILRILPSLHGAFGVSSAPYAIRHLSPPRSRRGSWLGYASHRPWLPTGTVDFAVAGKKSPVHRSELAGLDMTEAATRLSCTHLNTDPYMLFIVSLMSQQLSIVGYAVSRR